MAMFIPPGKSVSIHAPAWGATQRHISTHLQILVSIHAPAWGATEVKIMTDDEFMFQSTLPHGERHESVQ